MSKELKIRTLREDEILVSIERVRENPTRKGTYLGEVVLYKDARVDMRILDEMFGLHWKRTHTIVNGMNYCTISVWDDTIKEWISREDVGVSQGTFEREKSAASDAFKRAGFNFGIGRELYTSPDDAYVSLRENEIEIGKDGRLYVRRDVQFYVSLIDYDQNRKIKTLVVNGPDNSPRYAFPTEVANALRAKAEAHAAQEKAAPAPTSQPQPAAKPTGAYAVPAGMPPVPPTAFPTLPQAPGSVS